MVAPKLPTTGPGKQTDIVRQYGVDLTSFDQGFVEFDENAVDPRFDLNVATALGAPHGLVRRWPTGNQLVATSAS